MADIFYDDFGQTGNPWVTIQGPSQTTPSNPPVSGDNAYFGYYNGPGLITSGTVGSDFGDVSAAFFYQGPWTIAGNHTFTTELIDQTTGSSGITFDGGTDTIGLLGRSDRSHQRRRQCHCCAWRHTYWS